MTFERSVTEYQSDRKVSMVTESPEQSDASTRLSRTLADGLRSRGQAFFPLRCSELRHLNRNRRSLVAACTSFSSPSKTSTYGFFNRGTVMFHSPVASSLTIGVEKPVLRC